MKIWTNVKLWLPCVLIALLLCGMIGGTYAKYVKQDRLEGSVTIKAELGTIELWEHKAVDPDGDGEYTLDENEEVQENTYQLLPGLDIPKDPFVRITGKSPIAVYVFVEVVDTLGDNSGISYSLTADWQELAGVTGANDGKVYVYKAVVTDTFGGDIKILKDDRVCVSQYLDKGVTGLTLTFYASMYEVASVAKSDGESHQDHAGKVYSQNNS